MIKLKIKFFFKKILKNFITTLNFLKFGDSRYLNFMANYPNLIFNS